MDTKMLKFFMSVYENRSINKAAKVMMMTSQGVSRILNNIEEEIGTQLFLRNTTGVIPNKNADILYQDAKALIDRFELIQQKINQQERMVSNIRIVCAKGVLNALSIQVITGFSKMYQEYNVTWEVMSNSQAKEVVKTCRAEVGLVIGPCEDDQLYEEFITSRGLIALIHEGHPLYDKEAIDIEAFKKEKVIILNEQFHLYHEFINSCKKKGIVLDEMIKVDDSQLLFQLCLEKMGIGVLIDFSVQNYDLKGVRALKIKNNLTWNINMICHKSNKDIKVISTYLEFLKNSRITCEDD